MALISDAGHMLTDVAAIGMALFAGKLARKPKDSSRTYGYLRAEIIGALLNGIFLILICGYIFIEAYHRIDEAHAIPGGPVMIVGAVGLIINLLSAWVIHDSSKNNLNIEGAYRHMMADALGSVGAIVAGAVIIMTGWTPIDTIASVFIGLLILVSAWQLLNKSVDILMEGTPAEINYSEIEAALKSQEHIDDIHDLHIWTITSGVLALSAHIELTDKCVDSGHWSECLKATQDFLKERWAIEHTTIQTEPSDFKKGARTPITR